ncbi:predicted protein [Naegleria gruberi]|uniref:Predicted protein n=1 Tax=Naegleria gruberi TaxID=5762 RepID=D2VKW3_NAEGR|nr:uncharacterized protein NAEGRDRAFT_69573 [Naegleria gruberi]EFC42436.1 predicted protein [Naegleria gruberi]|eukprot:XP_002675180.1 predicted protein [Naegleria gruberi strain NEG-M]
MKRLSPLLCLVFVIVWVNSALANSSSSFLLFETSMNVKQLNALKSDVVSHGYDYLTMFIWKSSINKFDWSSSEEQYNFTTLYQHSADFSYLEQRLSNNMLAQVKRVVSSTRSKSLQSVIPLGVKSLTQSSSSSTFSIGIDSAVSDEFSNFASFNNVRVDANSLLFSMNLQMCRLTNVYEDYDVMITTMSQFVNNIRYYREGSGKKKSASEYINTSDFYIVPLVPFSVVVNSDSIQSISVHSVSSNPISGSDQLEKLKNSGQALYVINNEKECFSNQLYFGDQSDKNSLLMLTRMGQLTSRDQSYLNTKFGSSIISYNTSLYNSLMDTLQKDYKNIRNGWTMNETISSLLTSSCHPCSTTYCITFNDNDYWIIPHFVICILYFSYLFLSRYFKRPAISRRLLVPIIPFLECVISEIAFMNFWDPICNRIFWYICMFVNCFSALLYVFTFVRFYYLKNLHFFMTRVQKESHIKLLKYLGSASFGLWVTPLASFIITLLLTAHGLPMFAIPTYSVHEESIIFYVVVVLCAGAIVLIVDVIVNRKYIKAKGIRSFLLFDDPFYLRIDMIAVVCALVAIIVYIILKLAATDALSPAVIGIPRFVANVFVILFCGGNALIGETWKDIKYRKQNKDLNENDENLNRSVLLQTYLQNADFHELFKHYCEKEFSGENMNLFDELEKLRSNGNKELKLEIIARIERDFIHPQSRYSVNISAEANNNFYGLLKTVKNKNSDNVSVTSGTSNGDSVKVEQMVKILSDDISTNMYDTFTRFCRSNEYVKWKHVYDLQKAQDRF